MKKCESYSDLQRMVSEWIESWDIMSYAVSYDFLVKRLTEKASDVLYENDIEYGDLFDTDIIDLESLSQEFEKNQPLYIFQDGDEGGDFLVCVPKWEKRWYDRYKEYKGKITVTCKNNAISEMSEEKVNDLLLKGVREYKKGKEKFEF